MNKVKEEKSQFVKELSELLSKYGVFQVKSIEYSDEVYDETLIVELQSGAKVNVNVTYDSLDMMLKDLVKGL